jgi:hypothetical protein
MFITTNKIKFNVDLRTKDVFTVKNFVQYEDGRPVDILEASETGTLTMIYGDIKTMVDVMFYLCLDQIKEHFDVQKYDTENQKTYEFQPELATETTLVKASRWFGSIINGNTLYEMIESFKDAVVNFTPDENRRKALRAILDKERETQKLESEYRIKTVNKIFEQAKTDLGDRWRRLETQELQNLKTTLDGLIGLSGNTPE